MIDRKAFWISATIVLATSGAALWRLSLLPDWNAMPVEGPNTHHTVTGLTLFFGPALLLLAIGIAFVREWMTGGPEESRKPWRRWSGLLVVSFGLILALLQVFLIARSLIPGVELYGDKVDRLIMILLGVALIALGNVMPKLPWLQARPGLLHLDPWQRNRHLRLTGKFFVLLGTVLAVGGILLSRHAVYPILFLLVPAGIAASIGYRIRLRREPSPQ